MQWTNERVEILTRLWADGLSARQIASKLGGVTRNAVIGKAHRLNLQRGQAVPEFKPEPKPPVVHEPPPINHPDMKPWMCRWPSEGPGRHGLNICGKTVQPGRHYCAEHLTLAYRQRKRHVA